MILKRIFFTSSLFPLSIEFDAFCLLFFLLLGFICFKIAISDLFQPPHPLPSIIEFGFRLRFSFFFCGLLTTILLLYFNCFQFNSISLIFLLFRLVIDYYHKNMLTDMYALRLILFRLYQTMKWYWLINGACHM